MAMDLGDTIMYGGMVRAANRAAAAAHADAIRGVQRVTENALKVIDKWETDYNDLQERALAHIHGLKARGVARKEIEAEMARIIAQYDPKNPMASVEMIEKMVDLRQIENSEDPELVKKTYGDRGIVNKEKYFKIVETKASDGETVRELYSSLVTLGKG